MGFISHVILGNISLIKFQKGWPLWCNKGDWTNLLSATFNPDQSDFSISGTSRQSRKASCWCEGASVTWCTLPPCGKPQHIGVFNDTSTSLLFFAVLCNKKSFPVAIELQHPYCSRLFFLFKQGCSSLLFLSLLNPALSYCLYFLERMLLGLVVFWLTKKKCTVGRFSRWMCKNSDLKAISNPLAL